MTADEFRLTPEMRETLRNALSMPAVQHALAIGKSKNELALLPLGMSGIDHARALAERQTRALFVAELFELTTALPDAPPERPPETFGTAHNVDEFDQPEKPE